MNSTIALFSTKPRTWQFRQRLSQMTI